MGSWQIVEKSDSTPQTHDSLAYLRYSSVSAERMGFVVEREVGCMFQLVKTPWKWNPTRFPGMAYEIVYVLRKTGEPKHVATLETAEGVVEVETYLSK